MSCCSKKRKKKNLKEQTKNRSDQPQEKTRPVYVDNLDENICSPPYQGTNAHSYQGYGVVSYPSHRRPHKVNGQQNYQEDYCRCMDCSTVSKTARDCPCMKENIKHTPRCMCRSANNTYPTQRLVASCPCTQSNMVHHSDNPCFEDGGVDGVPASCHLNLTIVNRGELSMNRTRDESPSRPFAQCYQEMKRYYQQQQMFLQEQHAQCFQQLLDMLQQKEEMGMQQDYTPPPGHAASTTQPPSNGEVLYDTLVNGARVTISGPRKAQPPQEGGFNLHIAVTPQPDLETRAAAKQEGKKKKYCC